MRIYTIAAMGLLAGATTIYARDRGSQLESREVVTIRELLEMKDGDQVARIVLKQPDLCRKLVAFYQAGTNSVPVEMYVVIGSCFSAEKRYSETIKLVGEYLRVHPNDYQALSLLGDAYSKTKAYGRAVPVLTNAAALIPLNNEKGKAFERALTYSYLAKAALMSGRPDVLEAISSGLLELSPEEFVSERFQLDAVIALTSYAIGKRDERIFIKAVNMVNTSQILGDQDLYACIRLGLSVFPAKALLPVRLVLQDAMEKVIEPSKEPVQMRLTGADMERIRRLLGSTNSQASDLYDSVNPELCRQLTAYYLTATNAIPARTQLAVSRCFGMVGNHAEAIKLAETYLETQPNDWRAWRIIGLAAFKEGAFGRACNAFSNIVVLGGSDISENYSMLATSAVMSGRLRTLDALVPRVLAAKDSEATNSYTKCELVVALVGYAICTSDNGIFVKAFDRVTLDEVMTHEPLRVALFVGFNFFKAHEVVPLWTRFVQAASEAKPTIE